MKKTNKILLKIVTFCMIFSLMFSIGQHPIYADVGDFETYDDWGGSSWDSGYDYSYDYDYDYDYGYDSDYDYDYDYDYSSGSYSSSDGKFLSFLLGLFIGGDSEAAIILSIIFIISILTRNSRSRKSRMDWYRRHSSQRAYQDRMRYERRNNNYYNQTRISNNDNGYFSTRSTVNTVSLVNNAKSVEQEIVKTDELFNREEFEAWVKQVFIKLQYAWTDRDWTEIRAFETNELFEQHNAQLERYKMKKQINVLERVAVNWVKLYKFYKTNDKEVVETLVNSKMIDYIIDEKTGEVIAGDKTTSRVKTYKLTFIRTLGVKTKPGETTLKAMNCPNCGGQLKITQAGKCEYCGSIVVVDDHGWALSELEPFTNN